MISTIRAANKRVQRLKKAGYTHSEDYGRARSEISKTWGENPNRPKHATIGWQGRTMKELQAGYKAAKEIVKNPHLTVGSIKKTIKSKRSKTFQKEYGISEKVANSQDFYNFLSSNVFQRMKESRYEEGIEAVYEALQKGATFPELKDRMEEFMENYGGDDFYIEDLVKALMGETELTDEEKEERGQQEDGFINDLLDYEEKHK